MILHSVESWGHYHLQHENCVEILRSCLIKEGSTDIERTDIWNNDAQYSSFFKTFGFRLYSDCVG